MRVRAVVVVVAAVVGMITVALPASAAGSPVFSDLTATDVTLDALGDYAVTVDATVAPADSSDTISSVSVAFGANTLRPPADWADSIPSAAMSTSDGDHFEAVVDVPRDASPGRWTATVTATDSATNTGSTTVVFSVLQKTFVDLSVTPTTIKAGGTAVFSGRLLVMQPVPGQPQEDGETVAYPGKAVILTWGDNPTGVSVTTGSAGTYSYRATVYTGGPVTATFPGTVYRSPSAADPVPVSVVHNATRIVDFNASPEPVYRNGYITVVGKLERNDPDGSAWLDYVGKTVTIYRTTPSTFAVTTTTDSDGDFRLTMHGSASTVAGTWYAAFAGTIYHLPSHSVGDSVITMTAPMRISRVVYNPPGADTTTTKQLDAEYVRITNDGNQIANLLGWVLHDRSGHDYTFTTSVYVAPGQNVYVHTGPGTNTSTHFYWGQGNFVWDNSGDTATLENDRAAVVDTCTWGDGSGATDC